jgi:hypothetical protein
MSSPTASTIPTALCAHYQKPAPQTCSGCKDVPETGSKIETTHYCSTECEKSDWANHKQLCKSLQTKKAFYRAGSVLQEIFYIYREKAFDKPIAKTEKKDGKMCIHEGKYGKVAAGQVESVIS